MPIFLVNWMRPGMRNLHRVHLYREFEKDDRFETVEFRLAEPREGGAYRVVGSTRTQWIVNDPAYPSTDARVEIGFKNATQDDHYWYWFNWIEPDRSFMLGWHRDGDHPEYGPTHLQINQGGDVVDRVSADVIDAHPGSIYHQRLEQLPSVLKKIEWNEDQVTGFEY